MTTAPDLEQRKDDVVPPFPSANEFAAYENAFPGAGNRLFKMAESEQIHRHGIEDALVALKRRGQMFALWIALSFLAVSGSLVVVGHDVSGTVIGSVDLVALTTVFIVGQSDGAPSV